MVHNENYRGYVLSAVQEPATGWQVSVHAEALHQARPRPSDGRYYTSRAEAFAAGRARVDRLLEPWHQTVP
jgi:hypothetical protein